MTFGQSGDAASANFDTYHDVGRDQYNTTNNGTLQNTVVKGAKNVRNQVAGFFGSRNMGNVIYNKSGDTINSVSNTKNGDSINNSRNYAYVNGTHTGYAGNSSFPRGIVSQPGSTTEDARRPSHGVECTDPIEVISSEKAVPENTVSDTEVSSIRVENGEGEHTLTSELVLSEANQEGDALIADSTKDCTRLSNGVGKEKPELVVDTAVATLGENVNISEEEVKVATNFVANEREAGPDTSQTDSLLSSFQSLTVKIKLNKCAGDGIAIQIPYHFAPFLSLQQLENGSCSVSIACPSMELSVSPTSDIRSENVNISRTMPPMSRATSSDSGTTSVSSSPSSASRCSIISFEKGVQVIESTASNVVESYRLMESHSKDCLDCRRIPQLSTDDDTTQVAVEDLPVETSLSLLLPTQYLDHSEGILDSLSNESDDEKLDSSRYDGKDQDHSLSPSFSILESNDETEVESTVDMDNLVASVLDTVNPSYEALYELYTQIEYENIMTTDTFYVVKGGIQTGIFSSSVLAGDCEADDPESSTTSFKGLRSALEYYHGNRLVSLLGASNSEVTIEAVPEPTTPLEVRSPNRNVIWGFSTSLATIRRRLDEQIRKLPYSHRVEGYYVVAVGREPGIYIDQEKYTEQLSGVSWGKGKSFGPNSRSDAEAWYQNLLLQGKIKSKI